MSRSRRRCKACGRAVRGKGIFLFETLAGPAEVCNKRCLARYNCGGQGEGCDCGAHGGTLVHTSTRRRRAERAA